MLSVIFNPCDPHVGTKVNYASNWVVYVNIVNMAAAATNTKFQLLYK